MNLPANFKYTNDHEWVSIQGDIATVGVTDYAQKELGDIVFVEVETIGETLQHGDTFGTIEAVKTVADMYMPVSGEVIEKNPELDAKPEAINQDAFGAGWVIKVKLSNPEEINNLLSADEYAKLIGA